MLWVDINLIRIKILFRLPYVKLTYESKSDYNIEGGDSEIATYQRIFEYEYE